MNLGDMTGGKLNDGIGIGVTPVNVLARVDGFQSAVKEIAIAKEQSLARRCLWQGGPHPGVRGFGCGGDVVPSAEAQDRQCPGGRRSEQGDDGDPPGHGGYELRTD